MVAAAFFFGKRRVARAAARKDETAAEQQQQQQQQAKEEQGSGTRHPELDSAQRHELANNARPVELEGDSPISPKETGPPSLQP